MPLLSLRRLLALFLLAFPLLARADYRVTIKGGSWTTDGPSGPLSGNVADGATNSSGAGANAARGGSASCKGPFTAHFKWQGTAPRPRVGQATIPEAYRETMRQIGEITRRGRAAEKAGDLAAAEGLYLQLAALTPGASDAPLRLAPLYDRMGRDRDAYLQYRLVVADRGSRATTHREDPRVLARYGSLCERFGSREEVRAAYEIAANLIKHEDSPEPAITPHDASFAAVKSAAFTAAASRLRGVGRREEALRSVETAVQADPKYWVARYYHAVLLSLTLQPEAVAQEARLAARLAPTPEAKLRVRWMQGGRELPDETGQVPGPVRLPNTRVVKG